MGPRKINSGSHAFACVCPFKRGRTAQDIQFIERGKRKKEKKRQFKSGTPKTALETRNALTLQRGDQEGGHLLLQGLGVSKRDWGARSKEEVGKGAEVQRQPGCLVCFLKMTRPPHPHGYLVTIWWNQTGKVSRNKTKLKTHLTNRLGFGHPSLGSTKLKTVVEVSFPLPAKP